MCLIAPVVLTLLLPVLVTTALILMLKLRLRLLSCTWRGRCHRGLQCSMQIGIKGIPIVHALPQCCMALLIFGFFVFCSSDAILRGGELSLQK